MTCASPTTSCSPRSAGGRDAEHVGTLLAVVPAHGCNIGLHTMAQITQGVTYYEQLNRISHQ
ncbi:MAG: hypothetical protein ACHRXM_13485 [Isosphaerales bacterium]